MDLLNADSRYESGERKERPNTDILTVSKCRLMRLHDAA